MSDRTPEDYQKAANEALEMANVLAGRETISPETFLEHMAHSDEMVEKCVGCAITLF